MGSAPGGHLASGNWLLMYLGTVRLRKATSLIEDSGRKRQELESRLQNARPYVFSRVSPPAGSMAVGPG
jgi:hypothetical protein